MNRKEIQSEIKRLVGLKNMYQNNKDYINVEKIHEQIKSLKTRLRQYPSSSNEVRKSKTNVKKQALPNIPDNVIIDDIDITDMLSKLKNSTNSSEALEIYNYILNLCNNRKNYINDVLKKKVNSYEHFSAPLKESVNQKISSLLELLNLDISEIDSKINDLINNIDSYDIDVDSLPIKHGKNSMPKWDINRYDVNIPLKLKPNIEERTRTFQISDTLPKSKQESLKQKLYRLKNEVSSYIIDKETFDSDLSCLPLVLKPKVVQTKKTLEACKSLNLEDINSKIKELKNSIDSYDYDKNALILKQSLQQEIYYINSIIELANKLYVSIKRTNIKNIKKEAKTFHLTKKQQIILNGMYEDNIEKCSIEDYFTVFEYFINDYILDKEKLIFIIDDFFSKFSCDNNKILIKSFVKLIKRQLKDFSAKDKKLISSHIREIDINSYEINSNDYRYDILIYFIYQSNRANVLKLLDKMPDISNGYYNGISVIEDILKKLLKSYNTILLRNDYNEDIITIIEDTFIKMCSINGRIIPKIDLIIEGYISKLKTSKYSTISKNIVLCRLNKLREKQISSENIEVLGTSDECYNYLEYYYREQLFNCNRIRYFERPLVLNDEKTSAYYISSRDNYTYLRIHVLDLTTYFKTGTKLYELMVNNKVNAFSMKKYTSFQIDSINPSITFEFEFYKDTLKNVSIYDSLINPTLDSDIAMCSSSDLDIINKKEEDFEELIKCALVKHKNATPYIVRYQDKNSNYKIVTELNNVFSKMNKEDVKKVYEILDSNSLKYGVSSEIVNRYPYSVNVLNPTCNYNDVLMQKIIRSYYNKEVVLSDSDIEYIRVLSKQYIYKKF